MVKFETRTSDGSVTINIRKLVKILLLISAIAFVLIKVILFLPIPEELKPVIFTQTPAFVVALIIGLSCFLLIYIILMATDRYVNTVIVVDENFIRFKQASKESKLPIADVIKAKEPDFITKKRELELLTKEGQQFIRFSSNYQMEQFTKLVNNRIEANKIRK